MNHQSSLGEALGTLMSTMKGLQSPESGRPWAPVVAVVIAALTLSSCSTATTGHAPASGITVLSIRAEDDDGFPGQPATPRDREVIPLFDDAEDDYLTSILRELPWPVR